jgi:hypothetical protein
MVQKLQLTSDGVKITTKIVQCKIPLSLREYQIGVATDYSPPWEGIKGVGRPIKNYFISLFPLCNTFSGYKDNRPQT